MLKTYARFQQLRLLFWLWVLAFIIWLALECILAYSFKRSKAELLTWQIYAWNIVILGSWVAFGLIRNLLAVRSWKHFEQLRQAAASGQRNLLAAEQPVRHPLALPLPSTIMHIPSWVPFIRRGATVLAVMVFLLIFLFYTIFTSFTSDLTTMYVIPLIVAIVFISSIVRLFWMLYAREYKIVQVAEEGLYAWGFFKRVRFIAWKDIKLLAIVNPSQQRFYGSHPQLEVSGANEVVCWPYPERVGSSVSYFSAPQSLYEQQIQQVLSLITVRTGLPLYDLRLR